MVLCSSHRVLEKKAFILLCNILNTSILQLLFTFYSNVALFWMGFITLGRLCYASTNNFKHYFTLECSEQRKKLLVGFAIISSVHSYYTDTQCSHWIILSNFWIIQIIVEKGLGWIWGKLTPPSSQTCFRFFSKDTEFYLLHLPPKSSSSWTQVQGEGQAGTRSGPGGYCTSGSGSSPNPCLSWSQSHNHWTCPCPCPCSRLPCQMSSIASSHLPLPPISPSTSLPLPHPLPPFPAAAYLESWLCPCFSWRHVVHGSSGLCLVRQPWHQQLWLSSISDPVPGSELPLPQPLLPGWGRGWSHHVLYALG